MSHLRGGIRPRRAPRPRPADRPIAAEHTLRTRVAWVDTDAGGRIHFTAAFRMAEAAETALRRELGLLAGWDSYPRGHVEADFLRVLRFEDEIDVRIQAERVGRTSIAWRFEIERAGEVCVIGQMVVVHVDADGRAVPIPETVRATLIA